jgi:toxin ParE1/3/4
MGSYTLSGKADADIEEIAEASLRQWGLIRAETYILGLHATFQRLAAFPDLGRDASHIRFGYRRVETASHSVFYRKIEDGVLIVRILHQRMDFGQHL